MTENDALFREHALQWRVGTDQAIGVLSTPMTTAQPGKLGVLIVVGGPQYRAGSHRQFTLLARRLASAGIAALRFDARGMGDSSGDARPFDALDDDIAAALQAMQAALPQLERWVLWGLCDAASASLLYVQRRHDRRIAGVCLLNPWVRSAQSQARTRVKHYYLQRLRERSFWSKLLSGKVAAGALLELARSLRLAQTKTARTAGAPMGSFQEQMLAGLHGFNGPVLLILSGDDYTAKEFLEYAAQRPPWLEQLARPNLTRIDVAGADHTFSNHGSHLQAEDALLCWIAALTDAGQCQSGPSLHSLPEGS
ncbi:hydrolase 1, exosortase A system-associated [Paucibacter soli]|uniref:hydrolase 1, exosortase A system-associated n=1 Tax=Paucibacter soli TaxID=3133433 RepID=UPI00309BE312